MSSPLNLAWVTLLGNSDEEAGCVAGVAGVEWRGSAGGGRLRRKPKCFSAAY